MALGDIPADIDCRKAADTLARVHSAKGDGFFRVFSPENEFLGIGEKNVETGCLAVKRVLQGE